MKKTLITLTLAFVCFQYNQAQTKSGFVKQHDDKTYTGISYVSQKRDTLLLPNDDLGKLILKTWDDTPKHKTPVILLVSEKVIDMKNQSVYSKGNLQTHVIKIKIKLF